MLSLSTRKTLLNKLMPLDAQLSSSSSVLRSFSSSLADFSADFSVFFAVVVFVLAFLALLFVTSLIIYHTYFVCRNMSTYANLKMREIFIIIGNPFSRKKWNKNCYLSLFKKYYKRASYIEQKENKKYRNSNES